MSDLIDLHTHSTASDGSLSPAGVVAEAARMGLAALALTDHDTVAGVDEALAAGGKEGLEVVPGVELSAAHDLPGDVHLLGLLIDHRHPALAEVMARIVAGREERNLTILEKLKELGLEITPQEVAAISLRGNTGRPHIGQALVNRGYVASLEEAMRRYIGNRAPAYAGRWKLSVGEIIELIHRSGGVAILAHPVLMGVGTVKIKAVLAEMKDQGLDGVEVFCPSQDGGFRQTMAALARGLDLIPTGGSDFHGAYKPDIRLGYGRGDLRNRMEMLDKLKERAASARILHERS